MRRLATGTRLAYDSEAFMTTDILIWSEQQAAALRRLASRRDLPNDLDLPNVIEEIEDVGKSEIPCGHESTIGNDPRHVAKVLFGSWRSRPRMRHWAAEIGDMAAASRPQRIDALACAGKLDLDVTWKRALREADLDLAERGRPKAQERIRLAA